MSNFLILYRVILEVPFSLGKKFVWSFIMCVTATWIRVLGSIEAEEFTLGKSLNLKWEELR